MDDQPQNELDFEHLQYLNDHFNNIRNRRRNIEENQNRVRRNQVQPELVQE